MLAALWRSCLVFTGQVENFAPANFMMFPIFSVWSA
jgi:hypothetical protein